MAKRYYGSARAQRGNGRRYDNDNYGYSDNSGYRNGNYGYQDNSGYRGRSEGPINHRDDRFNDEWRHDKDSAYGSMGFNETLARRANMNEFYAGMDARRRQEIEDMGMIHEDHRAIANLPQEVMIRPYPLTGPYNPEGLDDTIRGVDMQMDYDDEQRAGHFYPKKA